MEPERAVARPPGPGADAAAAARREARRAAVRAHHPDRGGDPTQLQRALAEADALDGGPPGPADDDAEAPRYDVRPTGRWGRTRRSARRRVRTLRGRLPRGVPGATRYHST